MARNFFVLHFLLRKVAETCAGQCDHASQGRNAGKDASHHDGIKLCFSKRTSAMRRRSNDKSLKNREVCLKSFVLNYRSLKRMVVLLLPPCADGLKRHWRTAASVALLKMPAGLPETTRAPVTAPDGETE